MYILRRAFQQERPFTEVVASIPRQSVVELISPNGPGDDEAQTGMRHEYLSPLGGHDLWTFKKKLPWCKF